MKPETTLTIDQIENFSINTVDNYEGCQEATIYLKKIYGEEVMNLTERREDFITLIEAGKSIWIMNFLLNTITKKYRAQFISQLISENLDLYGDESIKLKIIDAFIFFQTDVESNVDWAYVKLSISIEFLSSIRSEIVNKLNVAYSRSNPMLTKTFNDLQSQSQYLKSILYILANNKSNLTRSVVDTVQMLAEARQWKDVENYPSGTHIVDNVLKDFALQLVDFVGYFKEK